MNKIFLLLTLMFNFLNAEIYTEYFLSGEIKVKGELISGNRHGTWTWYNRVGKKWQEHIYDHGKLISEMKWSIYKPKPDVEIPLIDNIAEKIIPANNDTSNVPQGYTGTWIDYYESGNLMAVIEYMQGKKHGKSMIYRESGSLQRIERYISGSKNGKWSYYDINENIIEEGVFLSGQRNGRWSTYHQNGKIFKSGFYNHGHKNGKWNKYDNKGNLVSVKDYDEGAED